MTLMLWVKRIYTIQNIDTAEFIRGWQGHKVSNVGFQWYKVLLKLFLY
jgi:hypothetical protein